MLDSAKTNWLDSTDFKLVRLDALVVIDIYISAKDLTTIKNKIYVEHAITFINALAPTHNIWKDRLQRLCLDFIIYNAIASL